MTTLHHRTVFALLLLLLCQFGYTQNCYNSNFENGDLSGYDAYTGSISSTGNIVINNLGVDAEQHRIFSVLDGFDPIAEQYCTINKMLPVVPPVGGAYALRLGNSNNGAEAERVQIRFTVTNQTSFFLLRYAVLLNDPGHDPYEQPRFNLSITDLNGNEYPCGRYEVVAAPEIENFETCNGGWRVRPWTNIGIELLSYLGEEIIIELITTDCSRGGHAGYAYLDATCQPLQIELFDNCSDTSYASMQVTPGFDDYLWSTGDTTSTINIQGPVVGDIYYVTVTSATGCELVLNDTIPPYEILEPPVLDTSTVSYYCSDTAFWFKPTGDNLQNTYSLEYQSFVDSIIVNTLRPDGYTFIAYSDYGCAFDTVTHYFFGPPIIKDSINFTSCYGGEDGSIFLQTDPQASNEYSYLWSTGDTTDFISSLESGIYSATVVDAQDCELIFSYEVEGADSMRFSVNQDNFICRDSVGGARIFVNGGDFPYQYSYDLGNSFTTNRNYDLYTEGLNLVVIKDDSDCLDTLEIFFQTEDIPVINDINLAIDSCGVEEATISVDGISGLSPYDYSLDNLWFNTDSIFINVQPGDHIIYVRDDNGCIAEQSLNVPDIVRFEIEDLNLIQTTCTEANGEVEIISSIIDSVMYSLDNINFQFSDRFFDLDTGYYLAYAKNIYGCLDSMEFYIEQSFLPNPEVTIQNNLCFSNTDGQVELFNTEIDNPYMYLWDNGSQSNNLDNLNAGFYSVTVVDQDSCVDFFTYEVLEPEPLSIEISGIYEQCLDQNNGEIHLAVKGGIAPYLYSFDNGNSFIQDSFDINLGTDLYEILVKDDNDCLLDTFVQIYDYQSYDSLEFFTIADTCGYGIGSLEIIDVFNGFPPYRFSLDQIVFQDELIFSNLASGMYQLWVEDGHGCVWSNVIEIPLLESVNIIESIVEGTKCEESNGRIEIVLDTDYENVYWIDSTEKSSSPFFTDLAAGTYIVYVENRYGCSDFVSVDVSESMLPSIDSILVVYTTCDNFNNEISIEVSGGIPPYRFIMDDGSEQDSAFFRNVETGLHLVTVMDADSCEVIDSFMIESIDPHLYEIIEQTDPMCGLPSGTIEIKITGGAGESVIILDDMEYPNNHTFDNLVDGRYSFLLKDTTDCIHEFNIDLLADCQVYVPNIFSPNNDGVNDIFKVHIPDNATASLNLFEIYDKWGERIYSIDQSEISNTDLGWDGRFKNKAVISGVYVYRIDGVFYNGITFTLQGDVTLVE